MKKLLALTLVLMCTWGTLHAVPAKRGFINHTQSDGTTIAVEMIGDEFHHSFVTKDGLTVERAANGDFYYRTKAGISAQRAHNPGQRNGAEQNFVEAQRGQMSLAATETAQHKARRTAAPRKVGEPQVPTLGSPRVPIILIEYKDKKMSHDVADFQNQYVNGQKSAYRYFVDQSNGKYTPQYDIYGIYGLSKNRSVYGANDSQGNDKGVAQMVCDAIMESANDIDWSLYDNDGDGEADVCIVVYAGVGEAQASYSVPSSIWPCQWDLATASYYGDGTGAITLNGTLINRFAVFNETAGSSDYSNVMDGIGTFCHEFSHCLGLPDFYCTTYSGYYGMGSWSLMDSGCYNGGTVDGDTPIGYSAYEKEFMSWIDYIEPVENTFYTLPVFNDHNPETDQAIKITSPLNKNEYFILENRRRQGWDQYIPDEGLMISHFTYVESRWENNTVNNQGIQLATIIPADNTLSSYSESNDLYGRTNHSFTSESTPAAKLNMKQNGSLASSTGGAGYLNKPVTDITINNNHTVSFWYMKRPKPVLDTPILAEANQVTATSFVATWEHESEFDVTYTLQVDRKLPFESIIEESFADFTEGTLNISTSLNKYLNNPGWTGANLFQGNGFMLMGSKNNAGRLTTPAMNLADSEGKVTAIFKAMNHAENPDGQMIVSIGNSVDTLDLTSEPKTYAVVLDCPTQANQKLTLKTIKGKRAQLYDIAIYKGDASEALVSGDDGFEMDSRTITGITELSYALTNLAENAVYKFMVKAVPVDDTEADESEWSEIRIVTLGGDSPQDPGDVNGDGIVDIADVNEVINVMLGKKSNPKADINGDGTVDIADVNFVINIMLN